MSGIRGIIETHRARMENAGLMRQLNPGPLPEHIQRIASPHFRAIAILRELPERFEIQPSPLAKLFEYTLPKLEAMLNELSETRAEDIVGKLCEHGKAMIEKHGIDGSKEHLDGLFGDLPAFGRIYLENGGVEEIIESYRQYHEEGIINDLFLSKRLWGKISMKTLDEHGMYSLILNKSTSYLDLLNIRKARNISRLCLEETQVSDLTPLSGLAGLENLQLIGAQFSDLTPLSGLTSLRRLDLDGTQVSDLTPLRGLTSLLVLKLDGTQVSDLTPLSGLTSLQILNLDGAQVSDLTPLRGLTSLQDLQLIGAPVSDLTSLSGLTSMLVLNLDGTQVSDLTPLRGLTSLQELFLRGTRVSNEQAKELKRAIPRLAFEL